MLAWTSLTQVSIPALKIVARLLTHSLTHPLTLSLAHSLTHQGHVRTLLYSVASSDAGRHAKENKLHIESKHSLCCRHVVL